MDSVCLPLRPPGKRSQASLTERLKKVEDECKQKEEERVNLELELTEVKESLKKALSGGVTLGLTIEPKAQGSSVPQVGDTAPERMTIMITLLSCCSHVVCCRPTTCSIQYSIACRPRPCLSSFQDLGYFLENAIKR